MRRGDGEGAEELLREALEIEAEIAPDDRATRANTVGNLAMALQVQGRYDEAEPLLLEVLEIETELYGPSEPVASVRKVNAAPMGAHEAAIAWASLMRQIRPMPAATAIIVYDIIDSQADGTWT